MCGVNLAGERMSRVGLAIASGHQERLALLCDLAVAVRVQQEVVAVGRWGGELVADDEQMGLEIDDAAVEAMQDGELAGVVGVRGLALDEVEEAAAEELDDPPAGAFDLLSARRWHGLVAEVGLIQVHHHGAVAQATETELAFGGVVEAVIAAVGNEPLSAVADHEGVVVEVVVANVVRVGARLEEQAGSIAVEAVSQRGVADVVEDRGGDPRRLLRPELAAVEADEVVDGLGADGVDLLQVPGGVAAAALGQDAHQLGHRHAGAAIREAGDLFRVRGQQADAVAVHGRQVGVVEEVVLHLGGDQAVEEEGEGIEQVGAIHGPLEGAAVLASAVERDLGLVDARLQPLPGPRLFRADGQRRQSGPGGDHSVAVGVRRVAVDALQRGKDALVDDRLSDLRALRLAEPVEAPIVEHAHGVRAVPGVQTALDRPGAIAGIGPLVPVGQVQGDLFRLVEVAWLAGDQAGRAEVYQAGGDAVLALLEHGGPGRIGAALVVPRRGLV